MAELTQLLMGRRASLSLSALAGGLLCASQLLDAKGQVLGASVNGIGVRHAIILGVEANPDSPPEKERAEKPNATIQVSVRILNYAPDYRYYGVVNGKFSDFDPGKGAAAQEIWTDGKCHQNRGLPRIWVMAISGSITRGETQVDVKAEPRHIGKLVPSDEIVMQKNGKMDVTDPNQSLDWFAKTTGSRINIKLTIQSTKCRLNAN